MLALAILNVSWLVLLVLWWTRGWRAGTLLLRGKSSPGVRWVRLVLPGLLFAFAVIGAVEDWHTKGGLSRSEISRYLAPTLQAFLLHLAWTRRELREGGVIIDVSLLRWSGLRSWTWREAVAGLPEEVVVWPKRHRLGREGFCFPVLPDQRDRVRQLLEQQLGPPTSEPRSSSLLLADAHLSGDEH